MAKNKPTYHQLNNLCKAISFYIVACTDYDNPELKCVLSVLQEVKTKVNRKLADEIVKTGYHVALTPAQVEAIKSLRRVRKWDAETENCITRLININTR